MSPNGEVTLNTAVLKDLIAQAAGADDIELVTKKREETENLTAAQNAALNSIRKREVYDVSIYANGAKLENFTTDSGKLTIGLPYTLKSGETADGVWAYYVSETGSTERMTEGRKYERSLAIFETHHLSTYAVIYEKAENTEGTPADNAEAAGTGSGRGGCDAGAGMILFFILALFAVTRRRKAA